MSNKTLEQAIEEQSRKTVNRNFYDLQEADARERHFKMGAIWLSENLHLLSPSDVAKIPRIMELEEARVAEFDKIVQLENKLSDLEEQAQALVKLIEHIKFNNSLLKGDDVLISKALDAYEAWKNSTSPKQDKETRDE